MTVLQRKLMKNRQRQKDLREQEEDLVIMLQDNCDHAETTARATPIPCFDPTVRWVEEWTFVGIQCNFCGWIDLNDGAGFHRP